MMQTELSQAHPETRPAKISIRLEEVSVRLGGVPILDHVNAVVPGGESTAIVGPNGAGKTTITLAILGQLPYSGRILFDGLPAGRRRPRFGFVPQKLHFDRDIPMTVLDFLLSGIQRMPLFIGHSPRLVAQIMPMLEEVECTHLVKRSFGALSGGEMQRVLLAQALLQKPEVLILDEPTAGVDFKGDQLCCELLLKIRKKWGFTQLMISHDLATVTAHAHHVICLNRSVMAQGEPRVVLTHKVLTETFGLHLGVPDTSKIAADALECDDSCSEHGHGALHHCVCCHEHSHSGGEPAHDAQEEEK